MGFCSEFTVYNGEELVYVLEGQVQYHLEDGDFELSPGDSIHIDSHRKHQLKNIGPVEAVIISIGTLPLFNS
ncbi:cupin domain-containing protein [Crenobacter sp. SG2303]|uniref:Cupin domain-containing protein n=1 Tax=Crenobacter oryzisoli TaxID=3056844 RepID=A0ABT7XSG2_9NEIS|nr:cupin domain-containing protein [Crenobacter sp. SG2303]MDN0076658.1 cupin domain-containing protein [Crenobacter sp. SG2303]